MMNVSPDVYCFLHAPGDLSNLCILNIIIKEVLNHMRALAVVSTLIAVLIVGQHQ